MRVAVCDVDALMTHTVGNCQRRKSHVDQQTYVAVTKVVNPYALYSCLLGTPIHLVMKIMLADGENPAIRLYVVKLLEILLHLLAQELWHCNDAIALFCLGRCDDILSIQPLIGFVDAHGLVCKIEVCRSKRQKFALADSAPIKHFEGVV